MKRYFAFFVALAFAAIAVVSSADAGNKRPAKHKHQDSSCCCDTKCEKGDKKSDSKKTDAKKEETKKDAGQQ